MKEKIAYSTPDLELISFNISDVLSVSDPMDSVTQGSGGGQTDPAVDPFGDLPNP